MTPRCPSASAFRGDLGRAARRTRRGRHLGLVVLASLLGIAVATASGGLARDWNARVGPGWAAPSVAEPCGTDRLGRSVLRKVVHGAAASLAVAGVGLVVAVVLGVTVGCAWALGGRVFRGLALTSVTVTSCVPGLLAMTGLAWALRDARVLGIALSPTCTTGLALGLAAWPHLGRQVRCAVTVQRQAPYVEAAVALGLSRSRVLWSHVLPGVAPLVLAESAVLAAGFVHAEAALAFLGLGPAHAVSWGTLIEESRTEAALGVWWQLASAGVAILAFSASVQAATGAARASIDPRLRAGSGGRPSAAPSPRATDTTRPGSPDPMEGLR